MELADRLALLNAILNGISTLLLVTGWVLVRQRKLDAHRKTMLAAFGMSCLFLISYGTRFLLSGTHVYPHEAAGRGLYLFVLATHVPLAALVPVFALRAIYLAVKQRFDEHRRLMRVGLPIWLYVSVTGVAVYVMLYGALGKLPV